MGLGVSVRMAAVATPVPVRLDDLLALPEILSVAVREPAAAGEKAIMMVQEVEVATVPPLMQVPPEREKSAAFVPEMVKNGTARMSVAVPLLVMVMVVPPLVEPTF